MFAENGLIRTGVAAANTSLSAGVLQFELLDLAGNRIASSNPIPLAAGGRVSLFIHEIPGLTNVPEDFRGVLRVSSDVALSVVGIRGQINERGEFLISTTPAISEDSQLTAGEWIFPHIVSGSGYTTEFLLLSLRGKTSGTVEFRSRTGSLMTLPIVR
jgi:hypothetical protein